jgi:hypothetical protein
MVSGTPSNTSSAAASGLRRGCGIDELDARGDARDLRGVDHAELREARETGLDLGLGLVAQAPPCVVAARAQVDQRDPAPGVGERDGDATPHAARADGREARQRSVIRHRAASA